MCAVQIAALRNLKLNISRAKLRQKAGKQRNRFYITDKRTSDKVVKSARLEEIRLTILQNLLKYHPESVDELAWGGKISKPETRNNLEPLGPAHRFSLPPLLCIPMQFKPQSEPHNKYGHILWTMSDCLGMTLKAMSPPAATFSLAPT